MQSKLLTITLFAATAATVFFYPTQDGGARVARLSEQPTIDAVFVLDTTASMGDMIEVAKEKIWSIAHTMASAQPVPQIRLGLVAFRDRGDEYVTQVTDLSTDLDSVYASLIALNAAGGGDEPESVNQALFDAVHRISWSADPRAYKVVFLVGDAPPHSDDVAPLQYSAILEQAAHNGIVVNTIQCGEQQATTEVWSRIAQMGGGRYFQVDHDGDAVAIGSPFDGRIAQLAAQMDLTRMYYGNSDRQAQRARKLATSRQLHTISSLPSQARRAAFNISPSGSANFLGEGELIDDLAQGKVRLDAIDNNLLPESMQNLTEEEVTSLVRETAAQRSQLRQEIQALTDQRNVYIERVLEDTPSTAKSLDREIYAMVREQAARQGLRYEGGARY